MKKIQKWSFLGLGILLLFGAVFFVTLKKPSQASVAVSPEVGYRVPSFTLTTYPGNGSVTVASDVHKPMLINFWASWCPPCQAEAPDLEQAYKKYGQQVEFVGVNLTVQDSLPAVQNFLSKYGITYTTALDKTGEVASEYKVVAIPTSIFVNRSGVIVDRYTGAIPPQYLDSDLQRIEQ